MKRINAKLFADMWLSEAITDEQRELAARVAKSAMEFPEDKTHIDKFIEKRLEETTGPEHYYLEKLVKDYKEMQITQQANTITQPENCLLYGGVCCYPIEACSECPKHHENALTAAQVNEFCYKRNYAIVDNGYLQELISKQPFLYPDGTLIVKVQNVTQINAISLTQYDDPYLISERWQRGQKEDSPEFLAKWIGEPYREENKDENHIH